MLQRFKIDNRMHEVFVLKKTDTRIVYVPVKSLHRIDYERFKEMSMKKPPNGDLLDYMSKTKLNNGVNALVQYDNLIHVANVHNNVGTRVKKTEEIINGFSNEPSVPQQASTVEQTQSIIPLKDTETKSLYRFTNKHGKLQEWTGQGRVPDFLKEHIENGGDIDDYLVK